MELIKNNQANLNNIKTVALDQAWKILQLSTAELIQSIEVNYPTLAGKDKKQLALDLLSSFYDSVFVTIKIPFVPSFVTPIIAQTIKSILMLLVGASIDALVTTFRNTGIFNSPNNVNEVKQ